MIANNQIISADCFVCLLVRLVLVHPAHYGFLTTIALCESTYVLVYFISVWTVDEGKIRYCGIKRTTQPHIKLCTHHPSRSTRQPVNPRLPVCPCVWWLRSCRKGKGFPYSLPSVGPGADPDVQAVSPQVTISHPPGGRLPYFPPGLRLPPLHRASPPLGRYQVILLGDGGT